MKATLKFEDGREFAVDVSEETLKQIEKPVKKTGYEKTPFYYCYWYFDGRVIDTKFCNGDKADRMLYETANHYSDKTVAENNARADRLYRQLRRFAVEHREEALCWDDENQLKWYIAYLHITHNLIIDSAYCYHDFGKIYFDSKQAAQAAIEEFKDELIWYFTEYKDSL